MHDLETIDARSQRQRTALTCSTRKSSPGMSAGFTAITHQSKSVELSRPGGKGPIAKTHILSAVLPREPIMRATKLLLAAFSVVIIALAAPAHADSEDAVFLRGMHNQGISSSAGDSDLIHLGHMICSLRSSGYSENAAISMAKLNANGFTDQDAKVLVTSAEAAYCPEYIQ
jgi:hypothetical protein